MIKMGVMFALGVLFGLVLVATFRTVEGVFRFDTEADEPIVLTLTSDINRILKKRFIRFRVETNIQLKDTETDIKQ